MELRNKMKQLICMLTIFVCCNINAQRVFKKCKTCGKDISMCQYNGRHEFNKKENKKAMSWQTKDGGKTWKKIIAENIKIETTREVNLGLPSGTIWAGWNIDANSPEQFGGYYAYGEILTKQKYSNSDYVGKKQFAQGDIKYDVATYKWGRQWCIPTEKQVTELKNKCTWTYYIFNKVSGVAVTGPNGKSLFLPITEYIYEGSKGGNKCGYINAIGVEGVCQLGYANGYLFIGEGLDYVSGVNVRAVKK